MSAAARSSRRHAGSLGWRIAAAIVGCAALGIVATGAVAWTTARALALGHADAEFRLQVQHMSTHVVAPPPGAPPVIAPPGVRPGGPVPFSWVLDRSDRRTLLKMPPWPEGLEPDPWAYASDDLVDVTAGDGRRYRMLVRDVTLPDHPQSPLEADRYEPPPGPPRQRLLVLRDVTSVHVGLTRLAWTIAALGAGITLLAAAVAVSLRAAVLRPVRQLERRIAQVDPAAPGSPVEDGLVPRELVPIVDRVNALLGRVAALLARERRAAADIAHELRTPLAALRSDLEFARRAPQEPATAELLARLDEQARVLHDRVQSLMVLARIENGQVELHRRALTVGEIAADAWGRRAARADLNGRRLACGAGMELAVSGDPDLLRLVLANLVDNAVAHGTAGDCEVSAASEGEQVVIRVANATDLPDGDYEEAFAPFWRRDPSRSGSGEHAGLGLAIVRRVIEAHGGRAEARAAAGVFRVSVSLAPGA